MNKLLQTRYYNAIVARMKAEICGMVKDGSIHTSVRSFADLHDHIDANTLGGMDEESDLNGLKGIDALNFHFPAYAGEALEEGAMSSAATAALNDMHGDVSAWLAAVPEWVGSYEYFTKPCNPVAETTPEGFPIYYNTGNGMRCIYVPALGGLGWFGEEMSRECARRLRETNGYLMHKTLEEIVRIDRNDTIDLSNALAVAAQVVARVNGEAM